MIKQMQVVSQAEVKGNEYLSQVALFGPDGSPLVLHQTGETVPYTPVVSATAIGTAAKTTTASEPDDNTVVFLKLTNGNSAAAPTVAFDGGSARAILLGGTAPTAAEITVAANGVVPLFFDGTNLHMFGALTVTA